MVTERAQGAFETWKRGTPKSPSQHHHQAPLETLEDFLCAEEEAESGGGMWEWPF